MLAAIFPWVAAAEAVLDRRLSLCGRYVLVGGAVAALFGVDIRQSLAWQAAVLALALLLVAACAAWLGRPRLEVKRRLPPELVAGEVCAYRIELRNPGRRLARGVQIGECAGPEQPDPAEFQRLYARLAGTPARWVSAELAWVCWRDLLYRARGHAVTWTTLPPIPAGGRVEVEATLMPLRRGDLQLPGLWVLAGEPLGLWRSCQRLAAPAAVLVLPRVLPVSAAQDNHRRHQRGGMNLARAVADSEEFAGLRDYRSGDSRKRIYWRASARRGRLVVKETLAEYCGRRGIWLRNTAPDTLPEDFETLLGFAAGWVLQPGDPELVVDLYFAGAERVPVSGGAGHLQRGSLLEALARARLAPVEHEAGIRQALLADQDRLGELHCLLPAPPEPECRQWLEGLRQAAPQLQVWVLSGTEIGLQSDLAGRTG